ncbi:hypothetical protein GCM10027093_45100 [Paraburkholderia jirisanensis]
MQGHAPRFAARATSTLLLAALASAASLTQAQAQTPAAPATAQAAQAAQLRAAPPVDPTFSAQSLARLCQQKNDNVAQGQCIGAVRGIIHGYQYGVLFLAQRASLPAGETQRVSLCLRDIPVASIVDDFVHDASQVDAASLKQTPAEVALLGSVHMHHPCT